MTVENILREHRLKITPCRRFILGGLLESRRALSEQEIKKSFPVEFDRVTFYRTLKTLEDAGAIHKIVLPDHAPRYAVSLGSLHGHDIHSHFRCSRCEEVFCLHGKVRLQMELPRGFVRHSVSLVIEGVCAACN